MATQASVSSRVPAARSLRAAWALAAAFSMFAALPAKGEPAGPSSLHAAAVSKSGRHTSEPSSPPAELPHVRLTVEPAETGWTWVLRVESSDSVPLRLVGD